MRAPAFWSGRLDPRSREAAPLTRALLTPASRLYAWGVARRIRRTTPYRASIPVVCVGALTLGGAGKTPVAATLRDKLGLYGSRTATLSRGYGGAETGPLKIDPNTMSARDVGDEPRMLAAGGEAWIGRDRPLALQAMATDGVEAVVMDDGHQNPTVAKDLSILVIDADDPAGNGHVVPKGPLREPISAGLARSDAVVLVGEGAAPSWLSSYRRPVLRAHLAPAGRIPAGPLVAFAGIGRPQKFFDTLTQAGAQLSEAAPFDDHYVYTKGDLTYLRRLAEERGARLVTTEKDAARLAPADRDGILTLPVAACFDDDGALDALLARLFSRTAS